MPLPAILDSLIFEAESRAANTADDMRQLRNIVRGKKAAYNFVPDIKEADQQHRHRKPAFPDIGKGRQKDGHKHQAAGADERDVTKKQDVNQPGNACGNDHHPDQASASIFFFQQGAYC